MVENSKKIRIGSQETYASLRQWGQNRLETSGAQSPELDARLLLEAASRITHARLISVGKEPAPYRVQMDFHGLINRRVAGEPVHRIIGCREFFGRSFKLSSETLEPRPETEILIEVILARFPQQRADFRILDLGTGCGNIAVTLLAERPDASAVGVDIAQNAVDAAIENAIVHGVDERFLCLCSDMFDDVTGSFEVIVSNPPYIETAGIEGLQREVRLHDPLTALDGGADGLDYYRTILGHGAKYLAASGMLLFETGCGQINDVTRIGAQAGWSVLEILPDLSGHQRVVSFVRAKQENLPKND